MVKMVYLFLRANFVDLSVLSSYGVPERTNVQNKERTAVHQ